METETTPEFFERPAAAEYLTSKGLRVSKSTLGKLATTGGGPQYQRFGSRVVYTPDALNKWAAERLSAPRKSSTQAA